MTHAVQQAVVTGASGFLGRHLVAALEQQGISVITMGTGRGDAARPHLCIHRLGDATQHYEALCTLASVPAWIFHLAGTVHTQHMEEVNVRWARALLDATARLPQQPLVALVGSAAEYGPQQANPCSRYGEWVSEEQPCTPVSEYGKSKLAQTCVGLETASRQPVVVFRPFNILGRGMPAHLALGNFIRQAQSLPPISSGRERCIRTGPLHAVRDFIEIEICVEAMIQLARNPNAYGQIVNICTGLGTKLHALVDALLAQLEPPVNLCMQTPSDVSADVVVGSTDKLRLLGVHPTPCNISECIRRMLAQSA